MKMTGETHISADTLLTGLMPVTFELPKEIQEEINQRVGVLLSDTEIRKLRVQSAEKMREQIRWAVKEHIVANHINTLVREQAMMLVGQMVEKTVVAHMEKLDMPKLLGDLIQKKIEQTISMRPNKDGSDAGLAAMVEAEVQKQVSQFVSENMILRFVDKSKEGAW